MNGIKGFLPSHSFSNFKRIDEIGNIRPERVGVIPYLRKNGNIYFLLGLDRVYQEYTDFGGGLKSKETVIEGAIREFSEETLNIFDNFVNVASDIGRTGFTGSVNQDKITGGMVAYNKKNMILFMKIPLNDMSVSIEIFEKRVKELGDKNVEISKIKWFSYDEFRSLLRNNKIYERPRNMLRTVPSLSEKLKKLK